MSGTKGLAFAGPFVQGHLVRTPDPVRDWQYGHAPARDDDRTLSLPLALVADKEEKQEDDRELVERAYRQHQGQIYRFLRRRTGSPDEAEELTQRVFADAAAALSSSNPPDSLLAWLYAVAERRWADELRRRQKAAGHLADQPRGAGVHADPFYGPAIAQALRRSIAALPPDQRSVVAMKVFEELPFAEIAARLSSTEAACKMRFSRAARQLREALREEGLEP